MFSQGTVASATEMALSFKARNIYIAPKESGMSKLLETVLYPILNVKDPNNLTDNIDQLVSIFTNEKIENNQTLDTNNEMLDNYIQSLAEATLNNVALAQKLVIPLTNEILNNIDYEIEKLNSGIDNRLGIIIEENRAYNLFENETFRNLVARYGEESNFDQTNTLRVLPEMSHEKIRELLMTGHGELDELISDWLDANYRPEMVTLAFKAMFEPIQNYDSSAIKRVPNPNAFELLCRVIGILVASNLTEERMPEGIDVPLADLRNKINEFRNFCGYKLNRFVRQYDSKKNTGAISFNEYTNEHGTRVIEVISENYRKLTDEGVVMDVVAGAVLSNDSLFVSSILANREKNLQAFQQFYTKEFETVKVQAKAVVKNCIKTTVGSYLRENNGKFTINDKEVEIGFDTNELDAMIDGRVTSSINVNDTKQIANVVRDIITNVLFKGTMVGILLNNMNDIWQEDPYMDGDKVAFIATISMVIDSVLGQMKMYSSIGD